MSPRAALRRDLLWTGLALALVLAWELAGIDLALSRRFAGAQGFAWREAWWAAVLLHDDGRRAAWAVFAVVAWQAWRAAPGPRVGPSRGDRLQAVATVLLCAVAVPALRRFSSTSCPWDLAEFGGVAAYVPHWLLAVRDGGPGHCFPSGHAAAAFAFWPMVLLWQPHDRARARAWAAGVVAVGTLFGATQLVRGAHFASHALWSAWACWAIAVAARHAPAAVSALRAWARPAAVRADPGAGLAAVPRPAPAAARPGRRGGGR